MKGLRAKRWQQSSARERAVWCSKRAALYGGLLVGPSLAVVFWVGNRPALVELEMALGILACFLFLFFSVGLYRGVRLQRPRESALWTPAKRKNENSWLDSVELPDPTDLLTFDEGCAGVLLAALLAVFVAMLLMLLSIIFAQLGIDPFAVLGGAFGWVLYRVFRRVFLYGRRGCKGNLVASVAHAAGFTLLYTGWGFLLIELLRRVQQ